MVEALLPLLPEGLSPTGFLIVSFFSFLGSFITIAFGIGGGGLLLAIMAVILPPAALIPVHGVVQLGSNATRFAVMAKHTFWPALPMFTVGSLIGAALGGVIVVDLPPYIVQGGVGAFILWSVLARPPAWLKRWPILTGGISSFLTMFFGATGMFVAGYTKAQELSRQPHVATHAALMTVQHGLKVVVFGFLGFAFADWFWVIVALIGFGVLGTLVGKRVLMRISDRLFRRALDTILILLSLRLIWAGITGG